MTFEEFTALLPKGITGAIMRRGDDDKTWSIRLWEDVVTGFTTQNQKERFSIYLRGVKGETADSLFARALPVAEAYLRALEDHDYPHHD
jgi:hypothetical protein